MSQAFDGLALVAALGWLAGAALGGALYLVGCARGGRSAARAADEVIDDVRRESYAAGWAKGYSLGRGNSGRRIGEAQRPVPAAGSHGCGAAASRDKDLEQETER